MKKNDDPIIVEQSFDATMETVWSAITEADQMRKWYFDAIPEFQPVVGFQTQFNIKNQERNFLHMWEVTEVNPGKKITYEWKFKGYPGEFFTVFELFPKGGGTKLRLNAVVTEDFPEDIPEFTRESGIAGWKYFILQSLKEYLEKK